MPAGKYRHFVVVQVATNTPGAAGSVVDSWATHANWYVEIKGVAGDESVVAGKVDAFATAVITGRWLSTLTPAMRIKYGARIFHIQNVQHDLEKQRITIVQVTEDV